MFNFLKKRVSQKEKILKLLRSKKIVKLPEIRKLGIANHTARISNLRRKGYNIECKKTWDKKRAEYHSEYTLID